MKIDEENGNLQVRMSWDESVNTMICIGVQHMIEGLVPDDFRAFMENWDQIGNDANKSIISAQKIGTDDGVDTIKVLAKTPWPLSNRLMFSTRYLELD